MIHGFATEDEAILARKPGEVAIVLNGRPCVAKQYFIQRLLREGARFQTVWRGQDIILQVDLPE